MCPRAVPWRSAQHPVAALAENQRGDEQGHHRIRRNGVTLPLPQTFVDQALAHVRKVSAMPNTVLPPGVSDVQLSRVMIDGGTSAATPIITTPLVVSGSRILAIASQPMTMAITRSETALQRAAKTPTR